MIGHASICLAIFIILLGSVEGTTKIVGQNESIQAAIGEASRGDLIQVNGGIHYENIVVNKTLTLLGIGMPVIDGRGNGSTINLSAGGIVLEGFVVKGSNKSSQAQQGIKIISNDNEVRNNIVIDSGYGIALYNSRNNTLEGNNASYNNYGIFLDISSHNTIINNSLNSSLKYGIYLKYSENNTFIENNASYNKWEGVSLEDSNNNAFVGNNISYNEMNGIALSDSHKNELARDSIFNNSDDGINLYNSERNIITGNVIRYNQKRGIYGYNSTDDTFMDNDVSDNMMNGIELSNGVGNEIAGNNFSRNNNGIFIINDEDSLVRNNLASYNKNIGIDLNNFINGTIIGNTANGNRIGALVLKSEDNVIKENNFSHNELNGLSLEFGLNNTIDKNAASNNLGGIVLLDSRNNSLRDNKVDNESAGIALQDSHDNRILGNNASHNAIGIYLNRSNNSQIVENGISDNGVGIALNLSDFNISDHNYLFDNEFDILINTNETISKYLIWKDLIIAGNIERYLRSYQEMDELIGKKETTFIHAIRPSSPDRETSGGKLPVQIESSPGGAEIWIDGKSIGAVTPYKKILSKKGNHDIELFLSGYEPKKETKYISSPTTIKIVLTPIQPAESMDNISDLYLYIDSIPEGASIWIDKNHTGKSTPDMIYFKNPGNHTYELFISGYDSYRGDINLSESKSINITLIRTKPAIPTTPDTASKSPLPGFLSGHLLFIIILVYYLLIKSGRRSG